MIPILHRKHVLVASIQSALTDADWMKLSADLSSQIGELRARAVVLDLTLMDVMDSFATRVLRTLAQTMTLRGAQTILVGIQPDVAIAMVQLGLAQRLDGILTALNLEHGLDMAEALV